MRIIYLQDPGHGWIVVPASLVRELGCKPSQYSYLDRSNDLAYLEEDCDATAFLHRLRASGVVADIVERHTPNDAACRSLPRWRD